VPRANQDRQRYTIYLGVEQLERLRAESERTGAPIAEMIRRAIDAYLPPTERPD
jgi:predicted DNA-binding protein